MVYAALDLAVQNHNASTKQCYSCYRQNKIEIGDLFFETIKLRHGALLAAPLGMTCGVQGDTDKQERDDDQ